MKLEAFAVVMSVVLGLMIAQICVTNVMELKIYLDKILFCIENQKEGTNYGKHHYIFDELSQRHICKFCFLPKEKANYKPLYKYTNGKFFFEKEIAI